jgi:hypothetical protein
MPKPDATALVQMLEKITAISHRSLSALQATAETVSRADALDKEAEALRYLGLSDMASELSENLSAIGYLTVEAVYKAQYLLDALDRDSEALGTNVSDLSEREAAEVALQNNVAKADEIARKYLP